VASEHLEEIITKLVAKSVLQVYGERYQVSQPLREAAYLALERKPEQFKTTHKAASNLFIEALKERDRDEEWIINALEAYDHLQKAHFTEDAHQLLPDILETLMRHEQHRKMRALLDEALSDGNRSFPILLYDACAECLAGRSGISLTKFENLLLRTDQYENGVVNNYIGFALRRRSMVLDAESAINHFQKAFDSFGSLAQETKDKEFEAVCMRSQVAAMLNCGEICHPGITSQDLGMKNYPRAQGFYERALNVYDKGGLPDDSMKVMLLKRLGEIYLDPFNKKRDVERARIIFEEALRIAEQSKSYRLRVELHYQLGRMSRGRNPSGARLLFRRAADEAAILNMPSIQAKAEVQIAGIDFAINKYDPGSFESVLVWCQQTLDLFDDGDSMRAHSDAFHIQGVFHLKRSNVRQALGLLEQSQEIAIRYAEKYQPGGIVEKIIDRRSSLLSALIEIMKAEGKKANQLHSAIYENIINTLDRAETSTIDDLRHWGDDAITAEE
jgi:tetratricopeptide (TPR) repeat protein